MVLRSVRGRSLFLRYFAESDFGAQKINKKIGGKFIRWTHYSCMKGYVQYFIYFLYVIKSVLLLVTHNISLIRGELIVTCEFSYSMII